MEGLAIALLASPAGCHEPDSAVSLSTQNYDTTVISGPIALRLSVSWFAENYDSPVSRSGRGGFRQDPLVTKDPHLQLEGDERRPYSSTGVGGPSALNMSATTFQEPSDCFSQTVMYLPSILIGPPSGPSILIS